MITIALVFNLLAGFSLVFAQSEVDCQKVATRPSRPTENSGQISTAKSLNLCFASHYSRLWSANCESHDCQAWQKLNGTMLIANKAYSPQGTPAAHLCVQGGGVHRIIEYELQSSWIQEGVCVFEKDGSFVSDSQAFWLNQHSIEPNAAVKAHLENQF